MAVRCTTKSNAKKTEVNVRWYLHEITIYVPRTQVTSRLKRNRATADQNASVPKCLGS